MGTSYLPPHQVWPAVPVQHTAAAASHLRVGTRLSGHVRTKVKGSKEVGVDEWMNNDDGWMAVGREDTRVTSFASDRVFAWT